MLKSPNGDNATNWWFLVADWCFAHIYVSLIPYPKSSIPNTKNNNIKFKITN